MWSPSEPVTSRDVCVLVGSKKIASLQSQSQWGQLWLDPLHYKRYLRSGEWNNSLYFPSFLKVSGEIISWISTTELATLSQIAFKSVRENKHFLCVAVPALGMCPTITARVSRTHPGGTLGCHCFGQSLLKYTREHTHLHQLCWSLPAVSARYESGMTVWEIMTIESCTWLSYLLSGLKRVWVERQRPVYYCFLAMLWVNYYHYDAFCWGGTVSAWISE